MEDKIKGFITSHSSPIVHVLGSWRIILWRKGTFRKSNQEPLFVLKLPFFFFCGKPVWSPCQRSVRLDYCITQVTQSFPHINTATNEHTKCSLCHSALDRLLDTLRRSQLYGCSNTEKNEKNNSYFSHNSNTFIQANMCCTFFILRLFINMSDQAHKV